MRALSAMPRGHAELCKGNYVQSVKINMSMTKTVSNEYQGLNLIYERIYFIKSLTLRIICIYIILHIYGSIPMASKQRPDPKRQALREQGSLNRKADKVTDPLFQQDEFFDPRDVVQVKYEMLRRVHREGQKVSHACSAFGVSRPVFYQAQEVLKREGLPGLVPKKRGPRRGHKLTPEVVDFVQQERKQDKSLSFSALAEKVRQRFGVKVHPRSIERVLGRSKKKRSGVK